MKKGYRFDERDRPPSLTIEYYQKNMNQRKRPGNLRLNSWNFDNKKNSSSTWMNQRADKDNLKTSYRAFTFQNLGNTCYM